VDHLKICVKSVLFSGLLLKINVVLRITYEIMNDINMTNSVQSGI